MAWYGKPKAFYCCVMRETQPRPQAIDGFEAALRELDLAHQSGKVPTGEHHQRQIALYRSHGRKPPDTSKHTPPPRRPALPGFLRVVAVVLIILAVLALHLGAFVYALSASGSPWVFALLIVADSLVIYSWLYRINPRAANTFAWSVTALGAAKAYKDHQRKKQAEATADELGRREV